MRIYQRIIKLKYLSRMFSCNKPMCLRQTHVSNYCKFQLSSDIEKNPGPTPVYIDPSKTITAPMSLCPLIYNNKQGINSANHLVSIMNIQDISCIQVCLSYFNQTIIFNADRIAHTFKCVRGWPWTSIQWKLNCQQTKINTSRIIHDRKLRNCVTTALTLVTVGFSACL